MADLPLTGGCGCGAVRFTLSTAPRDAGYCHCTRCQHRTGTDAGLSASVDSDQLSIDSGAEHLGVWRPEGGGNEKLFCSLCGSGLFSRAPGADVPGTVRLGAFDTDPGVRPSYRQFVAYAAGWAPIPDDGLPRFPERRPVP